MLMEDATAAQFRTQFMTHVFISHSHDDADFVNRYIRTPLEKHGLDTWYSTKDIPPGAVWREEIHKALGSCKWFLIVLTPQSVGSAEVKQEYEQIRDQRPDVRILPILANDCQITDLHQLDPALSRLQHIDFNKHGSTQAARILVCQCVKDLIQHLQGQLEGKVEELSKTVVELTTDNFRLESQLKTLKKQFEEITDFDGEPWENRLSESSKFFLPKEKRRCRVIAVANIKGGVGKTTITQNLGATLWSRGKRVLLVDLDHQGSLSRRCLSRERFEDMTRQSSVVTNLFEPSVNLADFPKWAKRLDKAEAFLVGADERLHRAEEQAKVHWLANLRTDDIRCLLVQALHQKSIAQHFDYVLLDCPPRMTTAYINGMVASDYLLIPVIVDPLSVEGVPRQLGWVRRLSRTKVIPNTQLLGIVANRSGTRDALYPREESIWSGLSQDYESAWGSEVYCFQNHIYPTVRISDANLQSKVPAFEPELRARFQDLADEVERRVEQFEPDREAIQA